ncbi:MAG: hypothetical protein GY834_10040 [Bacteroidetes bacterium]|nr:hypothetical protein [Bacteroidota bacterium]
MSLEGLNNITSITFDLNITGNDALTSIDGLNNLTSIDVALHIKGNKVLTSLDGLKNLCSSGEFSPYPQDIRIFNNPELCSSSAHNLIDQIKSCPGGGMIVSEKTEIYINGNKDCSNL